ncbi:hypothetical protein BV22DRAFT_522958 [Leucogyrophana mollusca]|uniref:Uncharacterized protein n=1 Tax=Leucogyrophana mollusca TaxID=85980 RepID=A0ACB8BEW2_9AGAM|nr:hypothetical protein BV22DRAFT_522958 [Leucogyrophana mollusca]
MDIDNTLGSRIVDYVRPSTKECVQAVDSDEGRCLVENCSPTHGIEYYQLLSRKHWQNADLVYDPKTNPTLVPPPIRHQLDSLEWHWNLRANTLNLDARCNVFPGRYPFNLRVSLKTLRAACSRDVKPPGLDLSLKHMQREDFSNQIPPSITQRYGEMFMQEPLTTYR